MPEPLLQKVDERYEVTAQEVKLLSDPPAPVVPGVKPVKVSLVATVKKGESIHILKWTRDAADVQWFYGEVPGEKGKDPLGGWFTK